MSQNTPSETSQPDIAVSFDIALLPSMLRAVKLQPAIGLAHSASPAFMGAFSHLQAQLIGQSPLVYLDLVDEHAWFDMVLALRVARTVSTSLDRGNYSNLYETRIAVDDVTFTLTEPLAKDHPAHADIVAAVRAITPSSVRWKK